MDYDFEAYERLLIEQEKPKNDSRKDTSKEIRDREKDKDRDRSRDSRDKKKKRKDEKKRKRSRTPSIKKKKREETPPHIVNDHLKQREVAKQRRIEIIESEIKDLERKISEVERELEEARRQDLTVLMYCLPLKAKEKHIYQFFQTFNCGKIRDIRIIRDQKSGRSKGVSYVEFYQEESIPMALSLNERLFIMDGQEIGSIPIKIQLSQAEKNRQFKDQKNMQIKQNKLQSIQELQKMNGPARVQVTGLAEQITRINEQDIRQSFEPFGDIESVEIPKDDQGRMTGIVYVTFEKAEAARNMIESIGNQNFLLNGKPIKVQLVSGGTSYMDLQIDDDLIQNPVMRITLMKKLMEDNQIDNINLPPLMTQLGLTVQRILSIITSSNPTLGCVSGWMPLKHYPPACPCATKVITITNMWSELDISNKAAIVELKEEVESECKKYGEVEMVWVDQKQEGNVMVVWLWHREDIYFNKNKTQLIKLIIQKKQIKGIIKVKTVWVMSYFESIQKSQVSSKSKCSTIAQMALEKDPSLRLLGDKLDQEKVRTEWMKKQYAKGTEIIPFDKKYKICKRKHLKNKLDQHIMVQSLKEMKTKNLLHYQHLEERQKNSHLIRCDIINAIQIGFGQ